ncbi:MAG: hypothetical protein ACRDR6_31070 [Pseudonocardiaceae bacterium]
MTFAGNTATNNAAAAAPPSPRVRGTATAIATANSTTPEAAVHNRGPPGSAAGTSASNASGRTKCRVPVVVSNAVNADAAQGNPRWTPTRVPGIPAPHQSTECND